MRFEAILKVSSVRPWHGKTTVFGCAETADGYDIAKTGGSENLAIRWPDGAKLPSPGQGLRIILTDEVVSEPRPFVYKPDEKAAARSKGCKGCEGSGLQVTFDGEGPLRPYKEGDRVDPHDEIQLCTVCHP
jgi:hypothetical protein